MKLIKESEKIRKNIGSLIYEQQLFQQQGNDEAIDRVQVKIENLRCQLLLVEEKEKRLETNMDQG